MIPVTSSDYTLPYIPLPQDKASNIRRALNLNFGDALLHEGHIFTASGQGLRVHQAAFTDPERQDISTSGINFYYNNTGMRDEEVLEALAFSGAPFNLVGNGAAVSLFVTNVVSDKVQYKPIGEPVVYQRVPELLDNYSVDIAPQRIYRAKQGLESFVLFPDWNPIQLRLFAVEATRELLVEQFSAALHAMRRSPGQTLADEEITEAVVQLLAAVILAHKGKLGEPYSAPDIPLDELVHKAHSQFSRYFRPELIERCRPSADAAYAILQQVRFSSFVIDYLEEIYIKAYPSKEIRRWEGRYNTPLFLTQRILANLPIETLRPAERVVVDMTCGVGNFLQAAYGRLSQITDMQVYKGQLREHIFGNDHDELTAQLASLSLLLTSFTDHWRVDARDALQWTPPKLPTVIVGNPPFRGKGKGKNRATRPHPKTGKSTWTQRANDFLMHAVKLLSPGGYLAMVMPRSFVSSRVSAKYYKSLLQACDLTEVWELPSQIFPNATVRPSVIFARKKIQADDKYWSLPIQARTVQPNTYKLFKHYDQFTESKLSTPYNLEGNQREIPYYLCLSATQWDRLRSMTKNLESLTYITPGINVGSARPNKHAQPEIVSWLGNVRQGLSHSHCIQYNGETRRYPNDFQRPRLKFRQLFRNPKVILSVHPDPTWGQRVKLAVDRQGLHPSDNFLVVAPRTEQPDYLTSEVIASVLEWYVSNAWIVDHLKTTKITVRAIKTVPFPSFISELDCQQLTDSVRKLEIAAQHRKRDCEAQRTIDHILKTAYNLDDATFERLRMIAQWDDLDNDQLRVKLWKPLPNPAELLDVTGGVEKVNVREGTITLWLNGFPGLQTVPIADAMPGWMLRTGVAFRAKIHQKYFPQQSLEGVTWFNIVPQEYTYLSDEELMEELDQIFSPIMAYPEKVEA